MSVNAYVLINVQRERIPEVLERLGGISGGIVREVFGPYEVVVELETGTPEDLTGIVRNSINPIQGVTNTETLMWYVKDVTGL
jgi:DNA-binding Lrp family transcriptional regulator